jgi:hypothetical protein
MEGQRSFPYRIASHVFACRTGQHVVLLDIRRDRYLALGQHDAESLRGWIEGWPELPREHATESRIAVHGDAADTLGHMRNLGMLVEGPGNGKSALPPKIERPTRALIEGYKGAVERGTAGEAATFATCALTATALLRFRSLERIVRRVERRAGRSTLRGRSTPFDIDVARRCTAVFFRLRPFAPQPRSACLFDTLALSEFLARYGLKPRWVFGVALNPFAAHCWLQHSEIVINDTPENIERFTPIMVV